MKDREWVIVSVEAGVGIVALNRLEAKNALCRELVAALGRALDAFEADDAVNTILLTGEGNSFAAGADIREMLPMTAQDVAVCDYSGCCERLATVTKPVVAAVDGFALGGGCELVEMCDIVIASDRAVFSHPEVRLGTMPGAGGTQRLPKSVGKHIAMDMLLSGRQLSAEEACRFGLVSRVVPTPELQDTARRVAMQVASFPAPVTRMIKQAVRYSLSDHDGPGFALERKLFQLTFAFDDRREGMAAFVDRRAPQFCHR